MLNLNFPLKSLKAESNSLKNTFLKCKVRRKGHSLWSHLQFFKLVPIFPFPIISYHIYYDFYSYKFSVLTSNFILVSWTILAHIFSLVIEGCCRRHSFWGYLLSSLWFGFSLHFSSSFFLREMDYQIFTKKNY